MTKYAIRHAPLEYVVWIAAILANIFIVFPPYFRMVQIVLIKGVVYKGSSLNVWVYYNYYLILALVQIVGGITMYYAIREFHEFRRNEKLLKNGKLSKSNLRKYESKAQMSIASLIIGFALILTYEFLMLYFLNLQRVDDIWVVIRDEAGYIGLMYVILAMAGILAENDIQGKIAGAAVAKVRN